MNILSLFDGMSCGRLALDRLGIKVDKYYASEIDKYAIQVSSANYPDIIQIGDVCDVKGEDYPDIGLVMAGSPCQGFSFAGNQLAFDDPRSALFFEFVRILKEVKPKYFLLENVKMKKEFLDVISEQVGVEPILINSALVSAQNRLRYYWTNIPGVEQPEDRGIVLRDILETEPDEKYDISEAKVDRVLNAKRGKGYFYNEDSEKIGTVIAGYHKEPTDGSYIEQHKPVKHTERNRRHLKMPDEKSLCMTATMYKGAGNNGMTLVPMKPIKVGMAVEEVKVRKHEVDLEKLQQLLREAKANVKKTNKQIAEETDLPITKVEHWFRTDSSFAIPSDDIWFKLKEVLDIKDDSFDAQIMEFIYRDGVYESTQRVYSEEGKSPTITASNKEQLIEVRALTEQRTEESKRIRKEHRQRTGKDWSPRGGKEMVPREDGKMNTLTTSLTKSHILEIERLPDGVKGGALRGRQISDDDSWTQQLETRDDDKSNALTTVQKDSIVVSTKPNKAFDISREELKDNERQRRVYETNGKSPTVLARSDSPKITEDVENLHWRKLTPLECERLQTVPDNYTNHVSNTQRYKMLGNGWTIEVIAHILKGII
jgi:DNA-cytosine methyltransferase